jgi:hypothetical protein
LRRIADCALPVDGEFVAAGRHRIAGSGPVSSALPFLAAGSDCARFRRPGRRFVPRERINGKGPRRPAVSRPALHGSKHDLRCCWSAGVASAALPVRARASRRLPVGEQGRAGPGGRPGQGSRAGAGVITGCQKCLALCSGVGLAVSGPLSAGDAGHGPGEETAEAAPRAVGRTVG